MVEVKIDYQGELHCAAQHGPSGATLETDAPRDNEGRGESFSPTDLVATALGSCMATIMGIVARRKEIDLAGLQISVQKEMTSEPPRKIAALPVTVTMPIGEDHPDAKTLQNAAVGCPVFQSLHPEIAIPVTWNWLQ